MKKISTFIVTTIVTVFIFATSAFAYSVTNGTYYLPASTYQPYTTTTAGWSGARQYVNYLFTSIRPSSANVTDNYTRMKFKAVVGYGYADGSTSSGFILLVSGSGYDVNGNTEGLVIYEGGSTQYVSIPSYVSANSVVTFMMKGYNPNLDAYAVMSFNWN